MLLKNMKEKQMQGPQTFPSSMYFPYVHSVNSLPFLDGT